MRPAAAEANNDTPPSPLGLSTVPQKRRTSASGSPSRASASNMPTTFFLKSEEEVDGANAEASGSPQDSTYGVQSMASTVDSAAGEKEEAEAEQSIEQEARDAADPTDVTDEASHVEPQLLDPQPASSFGQHAGSSSSSPNTSPTRPLPRPIMTGRLAHSLAPLHIHSPGAGTESAPLSTPKTASLRSLRLSDEESAPDDTGSQAVTSSGEEEDEVPKEERLPVHIDESAPQLVMPSIKMPSRRPFTERGKNVGKLKIMVVGPSGAGKTSLIRSILQLCEDIVHVDALPTPTTSLRSSSQSQSAQKREDMDKTRTERITEIYASTRAYPSWWSDIEESWILKRRKGSNDTVLERNICFIDTPSRSRDEELSFSQHAAGLLEYIERLFTRNTSFTSLNDNDLLSMLSGSGGVQVDLILYLLSQCPSSQEEIDFLRLLCERANVIPVISKADRLTEEDILSLRLATNNALEEAGIRPFNFGQPLTHASQSPEEHATPFAVSSALSNDEENMDASLLMSPDYVQPLVSSDLSDLVSRVFDPDTAARLRHSSSKKFINWLRATAPHPRPERLHTAFPGGHLQLHYSAATSPGSSSLLDSRASSAVLVSRAGIPGVVGPSPPPRYALARWATDVQRSMRNERARFEALRQDERARWLVARLDESGSRADADAVGSGQDPSLTAASALDKGAAAGVASASAPTACVSAKQHVQSVDLSDPLRLLEWDERFRRGGLVVVKVLGGCGLVGALAVWWFRWWGGSEA